MLRMTEPHREERSQSEPGEKAESAPSGRASRRHPWLRLVLFLILLGTAALLFWLFGDRLSLDYLAAQEARLRGYIESHPVLVYAAAFAVYVLVTGLSLPGAAALTVSYAWYFGFWPTLVLVSFASTTGATVAFLFSRYLLREWVRDRFGQRFEQMSRNLEREGAFYLFTLRLIVAVPFFVINLVMGLTPIRTRTFWWVSQLGMLPGTAVYTYAGSSVPSLQELSDRGLGSIMSWNLVLAFALLGIFPLVARWIVRRVRGQATGVSSAKNP